MEVRAFPLKHTGRIMEGLRVFFKGLTAVSLSFYSEEYTFNQIVPRSLSLLIELLKVQDSTITA